MAAVTKTLKKKSTAGIFGEYLGSRTKSRSNNDRPFIYEFVFYFVLFDTLMWWSSDLLFTCRLGNWGSTSLCLKMCLFANWSKYNTCILYLLCVPDLFTDNIRCWYAIMWYGFVSYFSPKQPRYITEKLHKWNIASGV